MWVVQIKQLSLRGQYLRDIYTFTYTHTHRIGILCERPFLSIHWHWGDITPTCHCQQSRYTLFYPSVCLSLFLALFFLFLILFFLLERMRAHQEEELKAFQRVIFKSRTHLTKILSTQNHPLRLPLGSSFCTFRNTEWKYIQQYKNEYVFWLVVVVVSALLNRLYIRL